VSNATVNATNQPYFVSSAIVPGGTATTNFQTGSKVRYNNSIQDQTIAATSYSQLDMLDNRSGATMELNRYVNCPGQTITIRDRYRGRPPVNLTLLGNITGLNQIQNNGSPIHQGNITISGSGTVSGNLFAAVNQLRNLTINRPGATIQLSAAENLTVTEKITVSNGTFGHTGSGTITAGSAAASGMDVTGGTFSMSGSSNLSLVGTGSFTQTGGTTNLSNTGTVSILGNFSQTGGSFTRINLAASIQGNVSITGGTTDFSGSTVTLNGTGAQNLTGSANGFAFHNLTINKTAGNVNVAGGKVKITGTVNMPVTNTANLVTGPGNLTLVSDATGTGRIAAVLGGSLSGSNFTTQRFVNGGTQGWYFVGTPISSQTIGNWGDNFDITIPIACSGTFFNIDLNRNTIFQMVETAVPANGSQQVEMNGWRVLSSCAIDRGVGYRAFLKSNFFLAGSTFDNTGALASGPFNFTVSNTPGSYDNGGWNLVANPYPSNINWDAGAGWTKTNMQNAIYIWNGATNQYGSYVSGVSTNGVDNIIPSGQAFFVRANASPALQINENAKTAIAKNMFRTAADVAAFRMELAGNGQKHESVIHFNTEASGGFDDLFDAAKQKNPGLNLASLGLQQETYSIQGLGLVSNEKVIPLEVQTPATGQYVFTFKGPESLNGLEVKLKDNYLGQINQIGENQQVSFVINGDPASAGASRFEIIFTNPESITLVSKSPSMHFNLYPNPGKGEFAELETWLSAGQIKVTDLLGKTVYEKSLSSGAEKVRLPKPGDSGVYNLIFRGKGNVVKTIRWVVE
jgi:hypothetical protein